jgi:RNA polymerase sigma-70 factor (ECF subfamily)
MPALDPQSLPRHLDRLYRAAWALCGSPHDAEDLVQETFARVLARPRLLRGQDELAYLMTVLRNTFLTQIRTAGRRPRSGAKPLEEVDPVDTRTGDRPEEALQAREVFTVIAGLPERYRLALVAVDIAGLSYREAAVVLETREATIATRVFRARQQVIRRLEGSPEADLAGRLELERELAAGLERAGEAQPAIEEKPSVEEEPATQEKPTAKEKPAAQEKPTAKEKPAGGAKTPREHQPPTTLKPTLDDAPAGAEPTPEALAPEALQPQREGRPGRRRLMQRGNR